MLTFARPGRPGSREGIETPVSAIFCLNQSIMSGYYYPENYARAEENEFALGQTSQECAAETHLPFRSEERHAPLTPAIQQPRFYGNPHQPWPEAAQHQATFDFVPPQRQERAGTILPSNYFVPETPEVSLLPFAANSDYRPEATLATTPQPPIGFVPPKDTGRTVISRATSLASNISSVPSISQTEISRSGSPNASEMARWGTLNSESRLHDASAKSNCLGCMNDDGSWSCAYPGCSSRSRFNRGCDLRKHYKRHAKSLFCRHEGCPQATEGGFSSKKDRARHEAKHNPEITCEWEGCDRLFSRVDNMV